MKNNKVTKWIFSLLTFLPMLAVGVMSLYTIFNKNAYQSYNDEYISNSTLMSDTATLSEGLTYTLVYDSDKGTLTTTTTGFFYSSISVDWTEYGAPSGYNYNQFRLYKNNTTTCNLYLYADNTLIYTFWDRFGTSYLPTEITFTASQSFAMNGSQSANVYYNLVEKRTLDNAFEYSMSKFNDLGFDKVDFVGLFNDIFNTQYNVYTTFINCYLNYMLFVTLVTFVPRVLYWFINWSFGLVDKFTERGGM